MGASSHVSDHADHTAALVASALEMISGSMGIHVSLSFGKRVHAVVIGRLPRSGKRSFLYAP